MWKKRNTAQCTPRISRIYSPVPPRQHNASCRLARMAHSSTLRGATATPRFHHVSAPKSPRSPQQCQVGVSDRERKKKRGKFPGRQEKDPTASGNVQSIHAGGAPRSDAFLPPPSTCYLLASQPILLGGRPSPCRPCPLPHLSQANTAESPTPPTIPQLPRSRSEPLPASPEQEQEDGVTRGWRSTRRCAGAATAACAPSTPTPSTSSSGPSRSTRKLPPCLHLVRRSARIGLVATAQVCWFRDDPVWGGSSRFRARGRSAPARAIGPGSGSPWSLRWLALWIG